MVQRISWITGADRFILQFLAGHEQPGFHAPPTVIASNIEYSPAHVRARIKVLTAAGLTEFVDESRGYYAIADLGDRYLSGSLSEEEGSELEQAGATVDEDEDGSSST